MANRSGNEAAVLLALLAGSRVEEGNDGAAGTSLHAGIERVGAAIEYAGLGTWAWDLRDGHTTWSAQQYRLMGHEPRTINPTFALLKSQLHPDDLPSTDAEFLAAQRERRPFSTEYRVIWPNGEIHWVQARGQFVFDEQGKAVQMFGLTIDIDRLKDAERAAHEAHARLQTLAEATPGTLFTFRQTPDGTQSFPYITAHVRETHGVEPEDLMRDASALFKLIHPDDVAKVQTSTAESWRTMSMWHVQFRHNHPQKGEVWLEAYSSPIREADGVVTWHGIVHDITAIKQSELELLQMQRKAEAADRAKSEFLANMSHDIRTPMSAILGYAEILHGTLTDPDDLQSVETIARNGRYLISIIDDILDLSRIEAGKLEVRLEQVPPDTLVADVCALLKVRAQEKGLKLNVVRNGPLPKTIHTDPRRLRQILINLVENAIKFTERGEVTVTLRLIRPQAQLAIEVIDTGPGIPEPTLARLFNPFTQGDSSLTRRFGGTGLGLSICRPLARMLGGDIVVATEPGLGSTFTLTVATGSLEGVPLLDSWQEQRRPAWEPPLLRSLSCRVLVVDDRREMRHLAAHMLEEAGAVVTLAADGQSALHLVANAKAQGTPFDVVLLDMQMPVLDGYATAGQLRRDGYRLPIIALTAHAMKDDESRCLASGCDAYLSKPLDRRKLIDTVASYTGGSSEAPRGEVRAPAGDSHSGRRVLFVDDNADLCKIARKLLERAGHEVATATNGWAALAAPGAFDAVVLDLGLPGMSGSEVLAELKGRPELELCRFICLSGRSLDPGEQRDLGFDHYLQKPMSFDELQRLLPASKESAARLS